MANIGQVINDRWRSYYRGEQIDTRLGQAGEATSNIQIIQSAIAAMQALLDAHGGVIPTGATSTNPLVSQSELADALNRIAGHHLTYDAAGNGFPTRAAIQAPSAAQSAFYQGVAFAAH